MHTQDTFSKSCILEAHHVHTSAILQLHPFWGGLLNGKLKVSLAVSASLSSVAYEELYAFSYNPKQNDQQREEGWQLIDLGAEYERMGVPCDQWQLTDVNRDFKVRVLRLDLWRFFIYILFSPVDKAEVYNVLWLRTQMKKKQVKETS